MTDDGSTVLISALYCFSDGEGGTTDGVAEVEDVVRDQVEVVLDCLEEVDGFSVVVEIVALRQSSLTSPLSSPVPLFFCRILAQ